MSTLSIEEHAATRRQIGWVGQSHRDYVAKEHTETRHQILSAISNLALKGLETDYPDGLKISYHVAQEEAKKFARKMVADSLAFPAMDHRYDAVQEAVRGTFQWILSPNDQDFASWTNFTCWLQDSGRSGVDRIYWINGKAGSGKSTLMKFLVTHRDTYLYLKKWSGSDHLITSRHFSWRKGVEYERSIPGLLRAMLARVFEKCPDLMSVVLKDRITEAEEAIRDHWYITQDASASAALTFLPNLRERIQTWSAGDLMETLRQLTSTAAPNTKFFFFIDGLDEFEGDYSEALDFFQQLSESPSVKLCISSRPLPIFEAELGNGPMLKLQDLTRNDIIRVVNQKLLGHPAIKRLSMAHHDRTVNLAKTVIKKASGAFLWVTLVTKSLIIGLINHDTIHDLERRLQELPVDLLDLYWHMLGRIQPIHLQNAALLLEISCRVPEPVSAVTLSLVDDVAQRGGSVAIDANPMALEERDREERVARLSLRLQTICAGVLEVQPDGSVGFLHRTAGDFFELPEVHQYLREASKDNEFSADMALLRASVLNILWRTDWTCGDDGDIHYFWDTVECALQAANRAEERGDALGLRLMGLFDQITTNRWAQLREEDQDLVHWSNFLGSARGGLGFRKLRLETFLDCAVVFQLTSFVREYFIQMTRTYQMGGFGKLLQIAIPPVLTTAEF